MKTKHIPPKPDTQTAGYMKVIRKMSREKHPPTTSQEEPIADSFFTPSKHQAALVRAFVQGDIWENRPYKKNLKPAKREAERLLNQWLLGK